MGESLEMVFWVMAIAGTALFVLKTALLLAGADHGGGDGGDAGGLGDVHDAGIDTDSGHGHGHASDAAFTLLSVQSLSTLCMGAGWMGLAGLKSFGFSSLESIVLGLAFGLALVLLMAKLLHKAKALESSGTLDVRAAVGATGTVYVHIPEGGRGQIQVVLQGRLVTLDATTRGAGIATGATVRVDAVDPGGSLVVSPS